MPLMASELTLEQAVSKVGSQNRQVLQARAAVVARQAAVKVAETRRWPVLSTQVQVGALLNRAQIAIPQQDTVAIPRSVSGFFHLAGGVTTAWTEAHRAWH